MKTRIHSLAPVLFVLVMAPVTAEYLIGYDDTIANPAALIFGIIFFGPLYGAPAILIRELTRRRGLGWPTILLLATAFGLIEAGLIDQSLFDPSYRDIPYWQDMRVPTYLPWAGTSAYMALIFVAGHVFGSVAAPLALAESLWPARRHTPWLGAPGLVVTVVLWAAGASFILKDQFDTTSFRVSPGQVTGTVAVILLLVLLAFTRRPHQALLPGRTPSPWGVGLVSALLLVVRSVVPTGWAATLIATGAIAVWLVVLGRWSRRPGWGGRHVVAAAAGDMVAIGAPAFLTTPLGDIPVWQKLISNVMLLTLVLAVAAWAYAVERRRAADQLAHR